MRTLATHIILTLLVFSTYSPVGAARPESGKLEQMIERTQKGLLNGQDVETLRGAPQKEVVENLNSYLIDDSRDTDKRWFAAILMGRLGGPEAFDQLIAGLNHDQFFVRLAAIKGLELMRNPVAISALHAKLFDSAMVVRAAAADAVGRFSNRKSIPSLERGLFHRDNFIKGRSLWARKNFIYALGSIGGVDTLPALMRSLHEKDPMIHRAALESLSPLLRNNQGIDDSDIAELRQAWLAWWNNRGTMPIDQLMAPNEISE